MGATTTIFNKETGEPCHCDISQVELMTGFEESAYCKTKPEIEILIDQPQEDDAEGEPKKTPRKTGTKKR